MFSPPNLGGPQNRKKTKPLPRKFDVNRFLSFFFILLLFFVSIKSCLISACVQHLPFHSWKRDAVWLVNKCLLITSGPLGRIELEPGATPLYSLVIFFFQFPCRRWRNIFSLLTTVTMEIFFLTSVNAKILKCGFLFLAEWWAVWFKSFSSVAASSTVFIYKGRRPEVKKWLLLPTIKNKSKTWEFKIWMTKPNIHPLCYHGFRAGMPCLVKNFHEMYWCHYPPSFSPKVPTFVKQK